MERFVIVVVVLVLAVAISALVRRRAPAAPAPTGYHVPPQLHRGDFTRPDADWLVVVFSSATCSTCRGIWDKAQHLESDAVAVQEVEVTTEPVLHDRYGIDGVPTTVVADADGVVRASFQGPATATDLWASLAELRDPGSVPAQCDHHVVPEA